MSESKPTVFVVDDDASVRKSLSRLFNASGYKVETFSSAIDFLNFDRESNNFGCLVLDVQMEGLNGLELQQKLNESHSILPVVFLTGNGDIPMSVKAIKNGAVDFLPKPVDTETLLGVVENAIANYQTNRSQQDELAEFLSRLDSLTERERQVMDLVVDGLLNKQVASRLKISEATVKVHRGRVMEKTGMNSIAELARLCERAGI